MSLTNELTDLLMNTLFFLPEVLIHELIQYITLPKWVHSAQSMLAKLPFEYFDRRFHLAEMGCKKLYKSVRANVVSNHPKDVISGVRPDISELCCFEHEFVDPLRFWLHLDKSLVQ
jgi:hypothetical protein